MNVTEILQLADSLVFAKKGRHLDDLQESVVKGVWEGKTYQTIAEECHRSESRVRNVAAKLWELLSEQLGENIERNNFKSTFKRLHFKSNSIPNQHNICHINGDNYSFNYSPSISYKSNQDHLDKSTQSDTCSRHDLTLAPQIISFYDRSSELETLRDWIVNQNTRLVPVLGLSGIGKTTLVKRFIDLNLDKFEVIIWKSLKFPKSLDLVISDILKTCNQTPQEHIEDKYKQFMDILTSAKCLIVFDDVQNIFTAGQWAGTYQPDYQDYQTLFTIVAEREHQSHLILMSQEKCAEMEWLDEALSSVRSLELKGLQDVEILKSMGLQENDRSLELMSLYAGNPSYLKNIASLIKQVFDGNIADFLAGNTLIITQPMQFQFNQLFNRLSIPEQQLVLEMSKHDRPLSREDLKQKMESSMDCMNGLHSLQKRCLINNQGGLFNLSLVFQEYTKHRNKPI